MKNKIKGIKNKVMKFFKTYFPLENTRTRIEIAAILIAGGWAVFTFWLKDSPSLSEAIKCETEISIYPLDDNNVNVELIAGIKNSGSQVIYVDSTAIEYWLLPIKTFKKNSYFLQDDFINNPKNISNEKIIDSSLIGDYTKDQEYKQVYNFFVKKDSSKMIIMRARFFLSKKNILMPKDTFSTYDYTCSYKCIPDKKD